MGKNEIIQILQDWNLWKRDLEAGIPRAGYVGRVGAFLRTDQVLTVTGPRRAGKSFIMRQAATEMVKNGVPAANILVVNFEDPRFVRLDTELLQQIYEAYIEFLAPKGQVCLFLDEIQEVRDWEKWVRYIHELKKAKITVSGSNAKLLSRELGTLLTGRHLDVTVFPLSFREFLGFGGLVMKDKLDILGKVTEIRGLLRRYIEFGSFPEVGLSEQKKEILLNYFEDLVNKDLLRRFKIRKQEELKTLVKFYLSNIASLTTFRSIGTFLKISGDTVQKFSGYLEQAYLVFFLKRFSFKVKIQEKDPRKVYAIDTGLANAVGFRFSENSGHVAENVVFLELKRRQAFDPDLEIFYWKDVHHHEIDFVLKHGPKIGPLIQVCWNVNDPGTREREIRGLAGGMRELNQRSALVITDDYEGEETMKDGHIQYIPLWKWLIDVHA